MGALKGTSIDPLKEPLKEPVKEPVEAQGSLRLRWYRVGARAVADSYN